MPTNCYECHSPLRGAKCERCDPRYDHDDLWLALCAHLIRTPRTGVIEISHSEVEKACAALNSGQRFE